jgi:hypothetical protein
MADDVHDASNEQLLLLVKNLDAGVTNEEFNTSFAKFQALHHEPVMEHEFPAAPSHLLVTSRQEAAIGVHS